MLAGFVEKVVSGPPSDPEWGNMLDEFRALGGVAENVMPGWRSSGRGLFPCDPTKPFLLRVPVNLRFPIGDIEFIEDTARIRKEAGAGPAERQFFERYQETCSWIAGGRSEAAALISLFETLPLELRAKLARDFTPQDLLEGTRRAGVQRQFLRSRMIFWNNRQIFAPFVELANRSAKGTPLRSDQQDNLVLEGKSADEILVSYGPQDALGIFRRYGIPIARPHSISLPMKVKVGNADLTIARNLTMKAERGGFAIPVMTSTDGEISLSHLMIGNSNFQRASRGIFYGLMREAGVSGAEEAFDRILHFNRQKFLQLLEALEPLNGELVRRLRMMAHFQLEAMTHCIGTREF